MGSKFRITADNPKGLPYDWATNDIITAGAWVAQLAYRGAENISVNGELAAAEMIEQFQRVYSRDTPGNSAD